MHDSLCERCGKPATVTVGSVGPTRGGNHPQPRPAHRYCVGCARAEGVRIPQRNRDVGNVTEPELASWSEVEQHLAFYEQVLKEQPSMHQQVMLLARQMQRYSLQIPGPMPSSVVQAFARISLDKPE